MRDTPRTEVYVLDPLPQVVSADWARQLERELNAAKARIAELEARCQEYFNFVKDVASNLDHYTDAHRYGTRCIVCDAEDMVHKATVKEVKR